MARRTTRPSFVLSNTALRRISAQVYNKHVTGCPSRRPSAEGHYRSRLPAHSLRIATVMAKAWAPKTASKYANAVSRFMRFCDSNDIAIRYRLPASEFLLTAFASAAAGSKAGRSIRNDMAALRGWHVANNAPWHGEVSLRYVLRGCDNMTPASSVRPPRPPVTLRMLELLADNLDPSSGLDAVVLFTATAAFYGQLRLGELLATRQRNFDPTLTSASSDMGPANANGSRMLRLPHTKTHALGESIILCRQRGKTDPIAALDAHLKINSLSRGDGLASLCSWRSPNGILLSLTSRKFIKRCNEIWTLHGLPRSSGHEFRIGGTTHFLLHLIPPDVVKALGRWSSDAFLRYWRSLELLGPMYIEYLGDRCP